MVARPRGFPHPGIRLPVTVRTVRNLPGEGSYDKAGFSVAVDLGTAAGGDPLDPGVWEFFLDVRAQGVSRTVRLRRPCGDARDARTSPAQRVVAGGSRHQHTVVRPFFGPDDTLSLDVRPDRNQLSQTCHVTSTVWDVSARGHLIVSGFLTGQARPAPGAITLRAEAASGSVHEVPLHCSADGNGTGFTARLPVRTLAPGRWTITLHANETKETADVPDLGGLTGTHWFRPSRLGRPYYAKPLPPGRRQALVLRVAPVRLATALGRRLDPRGWARGRWGRRG
jgi:hypothetical protein